eukprot:scaffold20451_cov31-Phaeocystis_antarctica.AAC.1
MAGAGAAQDTRRPRILLLPILDGVVRVEVSTHMQKAWLVRAERRLFCMLPSTHAIAEPHARATQPVM